MAEIDLGRVVGPPGTTDYNGTENRPSINGTTLEGNKTPGELGIAAAEAGMGLSHNDYTDEEKEKLDGIDEGANNYTHPETHPASMIVQDSTHRFVSDAKQREWDAIYAQAAAYVNLQIAALIDGAPDDLNTLSEIARAMRENADVLEVLRDAVAKKANEIELAALAFSGSWDDLRDRPESLPAGDTVSEYSASGTAPVNGKAVSAALKTLDAAQKGGAGKYIQSISETDGKIAAVEGTMPVSLKNPKALKFTGGSTETYDGSAEKTVAIPGAMAGASAGAAGKGGTVPAPAQGAQGKYLRGDGTWQNPPNTTYGDATQSKNGLMSAADKKKLDGLTSLGQVAESIRSSITTGSWANANKGTNVIIDSIAAGGGWTALAKIKSQNGVFHLGVWKDAWYLNYTENSVAEGTTNGCTKQAKLLDEAGGAVFPGTVQAASFTGKFTNARKIELKGDVTGSVNFDGSANVAVSAVRRGCMVGQTGTAGAGSKPWYKVASVSVTAVNLDKVISFRVFDTIGSTAQCNTRGILTVHCRMNALGVMGQPFGLFWEHVGSDVVLDNYVLAYKITANTKIDLELWTKLDRNYVRRVFDVISESDTVSLGVRNWTLYNTQTDGSQAAVTSGYTQIKSVLAQTVQKDIYLWDGVHGRTCMYLLDDGDGATNNGSELIIGAAGNTFIGAGEAASNLRNALAAGVGTGESYGQGAEQMYVAADNNLWLYSACQTIANRKGVCLDTGGSFRPVTNKSVNLGHSSYYFNNAYISRVIGTADWAVRNKGCNLPQVPFTAGEAITAGSLYGYSVEEKGYTKLPANILSKNFPILYIDKAYAKGAAIGINNAYSSAINLNRSVLGITTDLKPGKPIFIKAGGSSDTITPYAEYYNDELPAGSADDASFDYAKSYMLLGYSVSTTTWNLIDEHPIWSYETYPGTSRKELINNVLDDGFDWFADKKIYESTCISLGRKQGTARGHYSIVFASNSTASSGYSVSIGGTNNTNSAGSSVILGGSENIIGNLKFRSAIIAGCKNTIAGVPVGSSNNDATIIGGNYNKIYEKASNTCIIAGNSCNAHGNQLVTGHYNNISDTANTGDSPDTGTGTGTAFLIGNGTSSARSNAMRVDYNGKMWCKQAYSATGADYAELFEWEDGNPDSEDRRGYFVTMSGKLIKKAEPGDWILGVVSGNPCVLGNTDTEWVGQFLRDEFGQFLTKEYTTTEKRTRIDQVTNEEGVTEDVEVEYEEEVTYTGYVLNPDYDPGMEYTDRMSRPEWDAVGMMGVLSVRDDGTCEADGFCTVAEGGTATRSESGYRVVKRINDHIVEIVFR